MPGERLPAGSAGDWLARAKGDIALASVPLPEGGFLVDLCYHAQQAVEKAIKAVYRSIGRPFRYTHDIGELLAGLEAAGIEVPDAARDAVDLTSFAWEARYPGAVEPLTDEEYRSAVESAEAVVFWAPNRVSG